MSDDELDEFIEMLEEVEITLQVGETEIDVKLEDLASDNTAISDILTDEALE